MSRFIALAGLVAVAAACDNIGGADTLVTGNNNLVLKDGATDAVAKLLHELVSVPEVSDAELLEAWGKVRSRAAEGDVEATLVLLRLAAIQRAPQDEAPESPGPD